VTVTRFDRTLSTAEVKKHYLSMAWGFGDVLRAPDGSLFMFINYVEAATNPIRVLDLQTGKVAGFAGLNVEVVERRPTSYREAIEVENPVRYWRLSE
jgi:hypothetical protein